MRYLFSNLDKIKRAIKNKLLFILLDYDGTLTPIRKTPGQAIILPKAKRLLKDISKNKKITLAVISGRSLADIKNKVGLNNIIYSGNHGLEISGPKIKFRAAVPKEYKIFFRKIKGQLKNKFSSIKGILLENKGYCLAFHFRLVNKKQMPLVKAAFDEVTMPYLLKNKIKIKPGKMVFDITPALECDKGRAVLELLNRQKSLLVNKPTLPVYIGDDITDEDGFRVLKNKGITIFVGKPKKSYAKYYLKNTDEVFKLLKTIQNFY